MTTDDPNVYEPMVKVAVDEIRRFYGPIDRVDAEIALGNWRFAHGLSTDEFSAVLLQFPERAAEPAAEPLPRNGLVLVP